MMPEFDSTALPNLSLEASEILNPVTGNIFLQKAQYFNSIRRPKKKLNQSVFRFRSQQR